VKGAVKHYKVKVHIIIPTYTSLQLTALLEYLDRSCPTGKVRGVPPLDPPLYKLSTQRETIKNEHVNPQSACDHKKVII